MKETFGTLPSGEEASLYTISCGKLRACITDYGANLVNLFVPDSKGNIADVVLGYDDCNGYRTANGACLGATVGRNANRIGGSAFPMNDMTIRMTPNEGKNNLHSGPNYFFQRMWQLVEHTKNALTLELLSPAGDQGFPGKAVLRVTYALEADRGLHIRYEAKCDRDTVFNMTNHSYFNLAGQENLSRAMEQELILPGRFFNPDDAENIPTGELRGVVGTPMDFREPKAIGQDIVLDYEPLHLQGGYDHNWEVFCNPCAILIDPESGREMAVHTDCPGIQFYAGNFLDEIGKGGIHYTKRTGVALETQFYPDSLHHPEWPQPITKAGQVYRSETVYKFSW
ncbi:MAG: galactose mutarotase [Oscillospiraceae bacterium]|nr:galactose mutarotase [Oscillospiraceae bacterium]